MEHVVSLSFEQTQNALHTERFTKVFLLTIIYFLILINIIKSQFFLVLLLFALLFACANSYALLMTFADSLNHYLCLVLSVFDSFDSQPLFATFFPATSNVLFSTTRSQRLAFEKLFPKLITCTLALVSLQ